MANKRLWYAEDIAHAMERLDEVREGAYRQAGSNEIVAAEFGMESDSFKSLICHAKKHGFDKYPRREMKTNEELLKENAELRATIECLKGRAVILEDSIDEDSDITAFICDARNASVQHLADIKANAVLDAAQSLFSYGMDADAKFKLEEYANKLRGESK